MAAPTNVPDLFARLTPAQHAKVKIILGGKLLVYDSGSAILKAWISDNGELVPDDVATRNALNAL